MDNIELKLIADYIEEIIGEDIKTTCRKRHLVFARVVYSLLALKFTRDSLDKIGKYIGGDHARIIHYRDKLSEEVLNNSYYLDIYNSYTVGVIPKDFITPSTKFKRILILCDNLRNENIKLKKQIKEPISIIANDYTDNELQYRLLSLGEQKIYNQRVQPILKMMPSNQKRKEVFEVITCQS